MSSFVSSQETEYIKKKGYEGFIFPKEHSIWGFPPEKGRYTPSSKDIAKIEKILKDSINTNYVRSNQERCGKTLINSKTLNRYMRQYVGYLTERDEIVIWINLFKKRSIGNQNPALDIISIQGGGYNFWSIHINITTKKLSDMRINGTN